MGLVSGFDSCAAIRGGSRRPERLLPEGERMPRAEAKRSVFVRCHMGRDPGVRNEPHE